MVCFYSLADRQGVPGHKHIVKGNISLAVRCRSLDQGNCDLWQFIIKKFFSVHFYIFDQRIINRNPVDARALFSGIHKNIQTYLGESSRKPSRLGPDRMGNTAQGQIIGLKPIFQHQLFGAQHCPEMTADQPVHRAFPNIPFRIMLFIPDPKAGTGNDGQVAGGLHPLVSPVNRLMEFHRIFNTHKRIHTNTISIPDQADRLIRTHYFIHTMPLPLNILKIILAESFSEVQGNLLFMGIPFFSSLKLYFLPLCLFID